MKEPIANTKIDKLLDEAAELRQKGQPQQALKVLKYAETLAEQVADIEWVLRSRLNMCHSYEDMGMHETAIEHMSESVQMLLDSGRRLSVLLSHYYHNIGTQYFKIGNYKQAIFYFEQALEIRKNELGEKHQEVARTLVNMGNCHAFTGDYEKMAAYMHKALGIQLQLWDEDHPDIAICYNNLAFYYQYNAQVDKQIHYYEKALRCNLNHYGEDNIHVAMSYSNLGTAYVLKDELTKALDYLGKALIIYKAVGRENSEDVARIYNNLAYCYRDLGDKNKELLFHRKALFIRQQLYGKKHPYLADSFYAIGEIRFAEKAYEKALRYWQKSLTALVWDFDNEDFHSNPELENMLAAQDLLDVLPRKANALNHLAATFENTEPDEAAALRQLALETINLAMTLIDELRHSYQNENTKLILSEKATGIYQLAMELTHELMERDSSKTWVNNAFAISEKSKSVLLLNAMNDAKAKTDAKLPAFLLEKEEQLRQQLMTIDHQIAELQMQASAAELQGKLEKQIVNLHGEHFTHSAAYEELINQFEQEYPEYFSVKYDVETASIAQIQQALPANTKLVEFFETESHIYLFSLNNTENNKEAQLLKVDKPDKFDKLLRRYLRAINNLNKKQYIRLGYQLYQLLLEPVINLTDNGEEPAKLLMIPHGVLATIPFESLVCSLPESKEVGYEQLDYLLRHRQVYYHYSATLWLHSRQMMGDKATIPDSFAGFAPVYAHIGKEDVGVQSLSVNEKTTTTELPMRSVRIGNQSYGELMYSEEEVNGIAQAFEQKGYPNTVYLHEKAGKQPFKEGVKGVKYVLVAAHGIYNKQQPELSGIIFSPTDTGKPESGMLYIKEAYHLPMDADLLVLSSCESGIGRLAAGEGMMAINRGFLYSGAANIIFTLFKVYDRQSSQLTRLLFDYILAGHAYPAALRLAKLQLIEQQQFVPKAWAGFVVIGVG